MSRIPLQKANDIIEGALRHARDLSLEPLAVSVLDSGGHLIALQVQDGAAIGRAQIAWAKASGALFLGMSSRAVGALVPQFVTAVGAIAPQGVLPVPGGILIVAENSETIGAVGISGDTSEKDEACAMAGVTAAGLTAQGPS
jgi:uncharacterized protein GlcG (DUF336 family)